MSEANNGGKVIQYNYKLEARHLEGTRHDYPGNSTSFPVIGFKWRYYPVDSLGSFDVCDTTKGVVISVDEEAGVICTDAGEILIRG